MGRIQRSWSVFKSSFNILKENKKLLIFPIINFIIVLFIVSLFVLPAGYIFYHKYGDKFLTQMVDSKRESKAAPAAPGQPQQPAAENEQSFKMKTIHWVIWGCLYVVSIFIATFLNVAFYSEILNAVKGNGVSIANGFQVASRKVIQIFVWACLAGSVGLLIKILEEKLDILGKIIMKIVGITWSIASLFVIPVIVTEENANLNPFSYLKKSSSIIMRTWGESLAGYVGFGMLNGLVFFCSFFLLIIANIISFAALPSPASAITAITISAIWLVALVSFMYVVGVAEKIYRGALYLYASEGIIPAQYSTEIMQTAWKVK